MSDQLRAIGLARLADSVEALTDEVSRLAAAASSCRTVDLAPVVSGPALGDPIGYAVAGPVGTLLTNLRSAEKAAVECREMSISMSGHCRVVAVYDLPTEVQP